VFRYALEQWPADSYRIEIIHSGPLEGEAKAAADLLVKYGEDEAVSMNLTLSFTRSPGEETGARQPYVNVYHPSDLDRKQPVWGDMLSRQAVERIVDSPSRRAVVNLLTKGISAVWLFLPCGDEKKDTEAFTVLEKELAKLQGTIELPGDPMADTWNENDLGKGPSLDISFSAVRIDRNDRAEEFFIKSLLRVEADLPNFLGQPMAFPVFGRGRVLYALAGKGINTDTIKEACAFITGPCSCLVKELNPGVDLLMRADWEGSMGERMVTNPSARMLLGVGSLPASDQPRLASPETATSELPESTSPAPSLVNLNPAIKIPSRSAEEDDKIVPAVLVVLGVCAAIAGVGTLVIKRSRERNG
jgi:hypothetical protein